MYRSQTLATSPTRHILLIHTFIHDSETNMPVFEERLRYICRSYFQITSNPRQSFSKKSGLQLLLEKAKGGWLGGVTQCNAYCPTFVGNPMEHKRLQSALLISASYSKVNLHVNVSYVQTGSDWISRYELTFVFFLLRQTLIVSMS